MEKKSTCQWTKFRTLEINFDYQIPINFKKNVDATYVCLSSKTQIGYMTFVHQHIICIVT